MAFGELGEESGGRHEQGGVAGQDRRAAKRNGQMRFAYSRRAQQQQVVAIGDPPGGSEIADLLGIDRRLGGEVEALEVADHREVGELQCHVNAAGVLAGDLPLTQEGERLAHVEIGAGCLVEQAVKLVADAGELQSAEHVGEPIGRDLHQKPPPTSASYSASERNSTGACKASLGVVAWSCPGGCSRRPMRPSKWAGSTTRCRRPGLARCTATSLAPWNTCTVSAVTVTRTRSPMNRHGTE